MENILSSVSDFLLNYGIPFILSILAFLFSISCHESAHGLAAYKLGDPTAKRSGRITLNPLKHFDLFAIIFFAVFRIGWAKGVPIDSRYFKDPKKGIVLSSLAGPVTNILLAFLSMIILKLIGLIPIHSQGVYLTLSYVALLFRSMVSVNLMLAIFNLLPIPPLDGSKIFFSLLPERIYYRIMSYDRIMIFVALALVFFGAFDKLIQTGVGNLYNVLETIVNFIIPLG